MRLLRRLPPWQWLAIVALSVLALVQVRVAVTMLHADAVAGSEVQAPDAPDTVVVDDTMIVRSLAEPTFFALLVELGQPGEHALTPAQAGQILAILRDIPVDATTLRGTLMAAVGEILRDDQLTYVATHPGRVQPSRDEEDPAIAGAIAQVAQIAQVDPATVTPRLDLSHPVTRFTPGVGPEELAAGLVGCRVAPPALALSRAQAARLVPVLLGYYQYEKGLFDMRRRVFQALDDAQRQRLAAATRRQRTQGNPQAPPPSCSLEEARQALQAWAGGGTDGR